MAIVAKKCEEVCIELQSMSDGKRSEEEYRVLSVITCTSKVMGGHQYGFCSWITEKSVRAWFYFCVGQHIFKDDTFYSLQED